MQDLHILIGDAVKDKVVLEPCYTEGTNIAKARISELSPHAHLGTCRNLLERLVCRLDHATRRVRIVFGDELPNRPQLTLNARIEDEFAHEDGAPGFVSVTGERLLPRQRLRPGQAGRCS